MIYATRPFRTKSGKRQFDAYLHNNLAQLAIAAEQDKNDVNNLMEKIQSIQIALAEQEANIKKWLRK